jgi:hypothetical protein
MNTDKSNKPKHFYCDICETRLDKVASWNIVSKKVLISKLNILREGIKSGDRISGKCNQKARKISKVKINDNSAGSKEIQMYLNDEKSVQIQK